MNAFGRDRLIKRGVFDVAVSASLSSDSLHAFASFLRALAASQMLKQRESALPLQSNVSAAFCSSKFLEWTAAAR